MAKIEENAGFYQKMAELQEKLRRSEEERLKLEEKFTIMMKSCREDEEARIRALRERYEKFLEDDKRRHERNERILQTLEKIESRAAILSAKTERLKLLRKHYEAYLIRMYPVWKNQVGYSVEKRFANQVGVLQKPDTKVVTSDLTAAPSNLQYVVPSAVPFYPLNLLSPLDSKAQLAGMYQQYGISPRVQDPGLYLNLESLRSPGRPVATAPVQSEIPATVPKFTYNVKDPKGLIVNGMTGVGDNKIKDAPSVNNEMNDHSLLPPNSALTDYIERAAELLKVPVEKAKEVYDEKKDEGKSTLGQDIGSKVGYSMDNEPEQNTSRDLLNISLSDDGILEEEVSKVVTGQTLKESNSHVFVNSAPQLQEENGHLVIKKQLLPPTDGGGDVANIAQPVKETQNQHLTVEQGQGDANEILGVVRKNDSELTDTNIKNIGYEDGHIEVSQSKEAIAGPKYVPDSQTEDANIVQNTTVGENILEQRINDNNWQDQQYAKEFVDYNSSKNAEYKERIEQEEEESVSNERIREELVENNQQKTDECKERIEQEEESVSNERIREELAENNQPKTDEYKERMEPQEESVSNEKLNDWQQQESEAEAWQQDNPSQFNISWKQQQEEFGEIAKDQKNMFNESYTEHRVVAEDQLQEPENNEYWQQPGNLQPEAGDFGQGNIYENQEYNENWQQENLAQEQLNYPEQYDSNIQQEIGSENNWPQHSQNEQPAVYDPNLPQYSSENMQEGEYTANWPLQEDNAEQQVQYVTDQGEEWQQQPYESDNPQEEQLETWQQQQQSDNAEQQQEELYEDNIPEEWEQQPSSDEHGKGTRLYGDTSLHRRDIIFEEDELSDQQQEDDDEVQLVNQDNIMQSTPQETPIGIQPEATQLEQTLDHKLYPNEEIKESDESLMELQNQQQPTVLAHELKRQLIDDPSESSSESRPEQNPSTHLVNKGTSEGSVEQYRNLLGVATESHSDTGGYSDIDEVEDQLAALVEQSTDRVLHGTEIQGESKPSHVLDESSRENELPSVTKPNPIKTEELKPKNEISSERSGVKLGKGSTVVDGNKPLPRPVAKKLPGLTKVLESDSESLHLDTTGGSNVDSDEFDFSSEQ